MSPGIWKLATYDSFGCSPKKAELSKGLLFSNVCFLFDTMLVPNLKYCLETEGGFQISVP